MITPSKSIPIRDSILYKMTVILELNFKEIMVNELYELTSRNFSSLDEFIYSLDFLFVLGKINFECEREVIIKC